MSGFSNILPNVTFSVATSATTLDSIGSMQSIFELDSDCNVILQGRIGQVKWKNTKITFILTITLVGKGTPVVLTTQCQNCISLFL